MMSDSKLFLSLFLFFFFFSFVSSSSFVNNTGKCSTHQAFALLQFKENLSSINDTFYASKCQDQFGSRYYPIMMNWNKNTDCCKWNGVTCNYFTGDIIDIDLSCGMLQGIIHPNTTLFHLPYLQRLNLAYNDLYSSQLPRNLTKFSSILTHLNISATGFTGEISSEFLVLRKLVSLDLSRNGGLRIQPYVLNKLLQNSTHLKELLISSADIGWALPTYLNISSSLKSLDLSRTGLQGSLPYNIFNHRYLEKLYLSNNYITGPLPQVIINQSSLRSLDLSSNGLQGKLPDNIFNIKYLETLDLSDNENLTGLLPKINPSISIPLKWLDLSSTNLSGEIPDSIGYLNSLNYLDLSSCGFTGSLPKSLANLSHLATIRLSDNILNGTLPSTLFTLPLLEDVFVGNNMFSGGLPKELFKCGSLKRLFLANNHFDGTINQDSTTPSFIQLKNLTSLVLSLNNFTGLWDLDTLLSSLPNLQVLGLGNSGLSVITNNNSASYVNPDFWYLDLASCRLTVFPHALRAMKNLEILDLSDNDIHGRIPDWVGEIGANWLDELNLSNNSITGLPHFQWDRLRLLYLQSNMIKGPIPPSICNMSTLQVLVLSDNSFGGEIPQCLENISSSLMYLNVKSNQIQGPFPPSICNMRNLYALDMSYNRFDGVIPQCFANIISSVKVINMENNRFHGTIPNVYEHCGILEGLVLNENQLQGEVPSSLSKCQSLKVLDLGNNQLNDTFAHWLGELPKLQVLVLRSNNFHGPVKTSSKIKNAFPSMRVFDLSHNAFVGHLPGEYFQHFNAMKNIEKNNTKPTYLYLGSRYYSINATVKGVELEFPQILVDYTIVDLSDNRFEGEIPGVIGSLTSLIVLNLSHNSLSSQIPYALGNLSEIESLDLSWNQLTGEIPRSLAELTFLGFLNLSQNHLVGRIPSGTQFSTFETSFGGNPELCGPPLPKKCGHTQEPQLEVDEDGDMERGFTWKVVMLGYGCGTLPGLVIGYLMLSTGRPKWFNAIVDAGEHIIRTRRNRRRYVYIGK